MTRLIASFLYDQEAAVATEYAVMLMLILMGVIAAITAVGGNSGDMWSGIAAKIIGAGIPGGP